MQAQAAAERNAVRSVIVRGPDTTDTAAAVKCVCRNHRRIAQHGDGFQRRAVRKSAGPDFRDTGRDGDLLQPGIAECFRANGGDGVEQVDFFQDTVRKGFLPDKGHLVVIADREVCDDLVSFQGAVRHARCFDAV